MNKNFNKGDNVIIRFAQIDGRWIKGELPVAKGYVVSSTNKYIRVIINEGKYRNTWTFIADSGNKRITMNKQFFFAECFKSKQDMEDYDDIQKIKQAVKDKIDNAEFTAEKWKMIKEIFDITT